MKPDGGVTGTEMEDTDVEPHELFTQLGMLVVESRLPELTAKGRRRGPHCPSFLGEVAPHACDSAHHQCQKAQTMLRQMTSLWRNRVPMCIEVVLLPDCCHGTQRTHTSNVGLPTDKTGSLLLEQWNIQVLPRRNADNPVSMKMLFQAVQSHLYFSQLSAWLNLSHGKMPTNVCYRILPPGDFCTSTFAQTPENHTFPVAALSKSLSLRVTAGCLPRMQEIPYIRCRELHRDVTQGWSEGGIPPRVGSPVCAGAAAKSRSPSISPPHTLDRAHSRTRFQKPRVVSERPLDTEKCAAVGASRAVVRSPTQSIERSCEISARPCDRFQEPGVKEHHAPAKHTGAIPKCFSHKSPPAACYESDQASSAPELESLAKDKRHSAGATLASNPPSSEVTSPKVILTHKSQSQVYYSKDINKVNRILQNVVNKDSSTDSDSSSPDIDRYLNKTLRTGHLDPLSPAEMENYLDNLVSLVPSRSKREYETLPESKQLTYNIQRCEANVVCRQKEAKESSKSRIQDIQALNNSFQNLLLRKEKSDTQVDNEQHQLQDCGRSKLRAKTKSDESNGVATNGCQQRFEDQESSVKFTLDEDIASDSVFAEPQSNGATSFTNGSLQSPASTSTNGFIAHSSLSPDIGASQSDTTGCVPTSHTDCSFHQAGSSQSAGSPPSSTLPFHKSISCPGGPQPGFTLPPRDTLVSRGNNASNLLRNVMRKEMSLSDQLKENIPTKKAVPIPSDFDRIKFQKSLSNCANMIFHAATGLPMQSSPAPVKKRSSDSFDYDVTLTNPRAIKSSISCVNLDKQKGEDDERTDNGQIQRTYSTSAPAITNCLLGNFEESMLNGRLEPTGVIEGFSADIGASGSFCPKHLTLPMTTFFFSLSDDNAPSPYLGHINLEANSKRGYHVPKKGTVQVTIFNPHKTVVKMFVVVYDLEDMPANCQTFLRQRTLYMPVPGSASDTTDAPTFLRYLIHLRFTSSKSCKIYLHTDIRVIFARDKFEFDSQVANYELRSYTEGPVNPKFSPKR